jgi:hypothetical protein
LEDFVAHIDAPQLTSLYIVFVDQIVSDPLQFIQFINRTPALKEFEKATIVFGDLVRVDFSSQTSVLHMGIPCRRVPWQLLSLRRVFTSSLSPFHLGGPLRLQGHVATHHRYAMAGTIPPIYRREESLPIRER